MASKRPVKVCTTLVCIFTLHLVIILLVLPLSLCSHQQGITENHPKKSFLKNILFMHNCPYDLIVYVRQSFSLFRSLQNYLHYPFLLFLPCFMNQKCFSQVGEPLAEGGKHCCYFPGHMLPRQFPALHQIIHKSRCSVIRCHLKRWIQRSVCVAWVPRAWRDLDVNAKTS